MTGCLYPSKVHTSSPRSPRITMEMPAFDYILIYPGSINLVVIHLRRTYVYKMVHQQKVAKQFIQLDTGDYRAFVDRRFVNRSLELSIAAKVMF